jgi:exodeoxyribonuclease V alpha subunit
MISSDLFFALLRAIPDGAKVICLGDPGQLEAIGSGNIAYDMIHSQEIPTVTLSQIHRQAAASAIITESIKIRQGKQIIEKDWIGTERRGELKDLELTCFSDKSNTYYEVMAAFSRLMSDKQFNVMETQVIVPVKNQGSACTYELNNALQEMYNPQNRNKTKKEYTCFDSNGKPYILREGDKVMNTANTKITSPCIFNGNIGKLKEINVEEEYMIIDFVGIGEVYVPQDLWKKIELGYAITVHKYQGSQADTVIFAVDFASYALLTRELLYTGITRAKRQCILIAQNSALRMAVHQEAVSKKQTHLQECLYDVAHPKLVF